MICIAIDIGLTGAIGFVDRNGAAVEDMPVKMDGKTKRVDGRQLSNLLLRHWRPGVPGFVVIEDVRARPKTNGSKDFNSAASMTSLVRSRGIVEGVADMLRLQMYAVQPQTWKRRFGLLGTTKVQSLESARTLYPSLAAALARKKDHNRAESLLIAHYGLEQFS